MKSFKRKGRKEEDAKGAKNKLPLRSFAIFFASFAFKAFPYLQTKER